MRTLSLWSDDPGPQLSPAKMPEDAPPRRVKKTVQRRCQRIRGDDFEASRDLSKTGRLVVRRAGYSPSALNS